MPWKRANSKDLGLLVLALNGISIPLPKKIKTLKLLVPDTEETPKTLKIPCPDGTINRLMVGVNQEGYTVKCFAYSWIGLDSQECPVPTYFFRENQQAGFRIGEHKSLYWPLNQPPILFNQELERYMFQLKEQSKTLAPSLDECMKYLKSPVKQIKEP